MNRYYTKFNNFEEFQIDIFYKNYDDFTKSEFKEIKRLITNILDTKLNQYDFHNKKNI